MYVLGITLNRGTRSHLIVGHEGHMSLAYLTQKIIYFINIDQNPMDPNPIGATSWWDSIVKGIRIVINPFLDPKMRSTLELSTGGVMFSVHRDSM